MEKHIIQAVTSKVEIREAVTGLWKHAQFSTNLHPSSVGERFGLFDIGDSQGGCAQLHDD